MRILIDSTQIPLGRTGVGVYAERLIAELAPVLHPQDQLYILIQDDDTALRELVAARAKLHPLLIPSSLLRRRWLLAIYEQCILPWVLLHHGIDVVHSLHYTFPLACPCSRIVTIHDLTFSLWPQMHTFGRRLIMPFFTRMALRHAEGVLFVSESTRRDAQRIFGSGKMYSGVTPLGVDADAFETTTPDDVQETLSRLSISRPYVLSLGTLEPRKNVARVVQAFERIAPSQSHSLVIAGALGWDYDLILEAIDRSPVKDRIHRLGYVTARDKVNLLAGCDLLAYPSLYEGFGLPVLEGMAAGAPVVTSSVSSLPEVAGDAAVLVDPTSVDQIATAMDSIISDPAWSQHLRQAAKQQARRFPWSRTAQLTYQAYNRTYAAGRRT